MVADERGLAAVAERLAGAPVLAVDVESNGLFKYRASLCTLQLATPDAEPIVVDALATPLAPLARVLAESGPRKIVHDIAFDARILAESGVLLGNVFDTSLAARMLGRTATGLAALLQSELGVAMDKKLQHHDWTERPLERQHIAYLEADVAHLPALAARLEREVAERGIAAEIEEETRYRLAQAAASVAAGDPRAPYLRMKGIDRVAREELPLLRRLAEVREAEARALDVPPYKVIGPDVLFAIAKARPRTMDELTRVKNALAGHRARAIAPKLLAAVAQGVADGAIPDADAALLERPRLPSAQIKARRAREHRLTAWRRAEAKRRGVDEQVVLPGHCLQDLADLEDATLAAIAAVPGIGAFRIEQSAAALLAALHGRNEPEAHA
ncbi:MAG: HRDC domain-containing protein [Labilithrix sp.]|nr:HRDC domain-containing protein [Labilithrix sp.]MCW5813718.1 HRDC domain-containing protein [Labilithrix sp.]